ncbi:MAG: hypothetical protein E7425_07480 [Ruminococcaceae bacterium]|nr:hypothetical protein [Oscillospiraceae bacterium]
MKKISANTAILCAVNYAKLNEQEVGDIGVRHADGLYEITFSTDWMQYDCFVDESDGEVLGFDSRPLPEHVMLSECTRATA